MVPLGDEAQVEARFGLLDIGARFAWNVPLAQKLFWTQPMVLQGDESLLEYSFQSIWR